MLIGLPRSGKSTWVQENKTEKDVVLSADNLRYLVYNQRYWQEGEPLVISILGIVFKMLLQQKKDIIVDQTNMTRMRRRGVIKMAKDNGYRIHGIVISNSRELCIERARKDGQNDLVPVIKRMSRQYQEPSMEEGFDEIIFVNKITVHSVP
jgi:predicted kinase